MIIKFKGKCIDRLHLGEWKKGSLLIDKQNYLIWENDRWYKVDPDTVGQFTGKLDRNGNEIYNGDCLVVPTIKKGENWGMKDLKTTFDKQEYDFVGTVVYDEEKCGFYYVYESDVYNSNTSFLSHFEELEIRGIK